MKIISDYINRTSDGTCSCRNPNCPTHDFIANGQMRPVPCDEDEIIMCGFCAQSKNYQKNTGGLGDLISNVLSKLGITEETVNRWLGIQAGCGCNKRKKFLNTILPFRKKE